MSDLQAYEVNPCTVDLVALALKQRHRIDQCPSCKGPRIWSLTKPEARCFRCNRYEKGVKVKRSHRLRCDECHRAFDCQGLKKRYCPKCEQIPAFQRRSNGLKAKGQSEPPTTKKGRLLRPDLDVI